MLKPEEETCDHQKAMQGQLRSSQKCNTTDCYNIRISYKTSIGKNISSSLRHDVQECINRRCESVDDIFTPTSITLTKSIIKLATLFLEHKI